MDTDFWLQKWEENDIGFHRSEANPLLVKYFGDLSLEKGNRVFLPLCGKTLDIAWLLSHGYHVAGAELSEIAIKQLFAELEIKPQISKLAEVIHYSASGIDIFVGNIFDLSSSLLGSIDGIYDRAALVALPEATRDRYTKHLMKIAGKAPQLLITFEYDQSQMSGPPFSISAAEVKRHYNGSYDLSLLSSTDVVDGLKGKFTAKENVWLLSRN